MATAQEIAAVLAEARKAYDEEWLTGLVWEASPAGGAYRIVDNPNWEGIQSGNEADPAYVTAEDVSEPRTEYMREKVEEAFGKVNPDLLEEAWEIEANA